MLFYAHSSLVLFFLLVVGSAACFLTYLFLTTTKFRSLDVALPHRRLQSASPFKILYIVTSVAEYDNGRRHTIEGRDRFVETLIPVVSESAHSMVSAGFHVDVYLISHYALTPERRILLQNSLPAFVHFSVWDDATPLSYARPKEGGGDYLANITRALARQHRYVIKDKFLDYDMFVNFEDDMLIHGDHVQQYLKVSNEIKHLKRMAPRRIPNNPLRTQQAALENYYGEMSQIQLDRVIPGFMRVEIVKNATAFQKRTRPGTIPVESSMRVDPTPCCWRSFGSEINPPPLSQNLFLWETHIKALGIRQMPHGSNLDWVVLQRGGNPYGLEAEILIGDYWSGRDGDFNTTPEGTPTEEESNRPPPMESIYANNQGGYMATREQIWMWHTRTCLGGFLPPFYGPIYPKDGMNHIVEYWSGGGSLVGRLACHLQRIIPLDPNEFSKHLLYHTSNNKQKQLKFVRGLFSQVDTLLGQLHTVKKRAEKTLPQKE